jgi:hypothetical protein
MSGGPPDNHNFGFTRATNGATLVRFTANAVNPTWYRVYDRQWRPTSPLLTSRVSLEPLRGLKGGFLAVASSRIHGRDVHRWVRVDRSGSLQLVRATPGMAPLRPAGALHATALKPGDRLFGSESLGCGCSGAAGRIAFYRPADHRVHLAALPAPLSSLRWNNVSDTGDACQITRPRPGGGKVLIFWSAGHPRTWRHVNLNSVIPRGMPDQIVPCYARPGRVVLFPGNDRTGIHAVVTWLVGRHPRVTSYAIDHRFDPWLDWTLPGGRALFVTNGGLLIASDRTNTRFLFRRAPNITYDNDNPDVYPVGGDLLAPPYRFRGLRLPLSTDHGKTWRPLDLKAGSWSRTR